MPRLVAAILLVSLWAASAERSSAAMWLVRGPGNTTMAADPACKAREVTPDDRHLWIDCSISGKHVTLLIASVAPIPVVAFGTVGDSTGARQCDDRCRRSGDCFDLRHVHNCRGRSVGHHCFDDRDNLHIACGGTDRPLPSRG